MYIFTGGESLVRKKDVIALCEKHNDCEFLSFTNGTLIDEEFCQEMLRVKNFVPAISLEGFEDANDSRRDHGYYAKVMEAMRLLKAHKLPFGVSTCYTSKNYADISSEKFYDMIIEAGALFTWFFHYIPVGAGAVPELLPTPEQRTEVYRRIRVLSLSEAQYSLKDRRNLIMVTGIVDVGGGLRGIHAAGILDYCMVHQLHFDCCIGASAGSANMAAYLAEQQRRSYRAIQSR